MVMPRSEEIDDSMLMHFLKEQRKRRLIIKHGLPFDFEPVKKSYTELYEMVMKERSDAKKKKALSHETFRDHLNRLVLAQIFAKYPKGKRQVYGWDRDTYVGLKTKSLNLSPEELVRRLLKIKHGLAG